MRQKKSFKRPSDKKDAKLFIIATEGQKNRTCIFQ